MLELVKSVKNVAEDRLKSPVFGAAALVIALNQWKIFPLIFVSYKYDTPADFLFALEATLEPIKWGLYLGEYLFAIFFIPFANLYVNLFATKLEVLYSNQAEKIKKTKVITEEEAENIRADITRRENDMRSLVKRIENERDDAIKKNDRTINAFDTQKRELDGYKDKVKTLSNSHAREAEAWKTEKKKIEDDNKRLQSLAIESHDKAMKVFNASLISFENALRLSDDILSGFQVNGSEIKAVINTHIAAMGMSAFLFQEAGDNPAANDLYARACNLLGGKDLNKEENYDVFVRMDAEGIIKDFGVHSDLAGKIIEVCNSIKFDTVDKRLLGDKSLMSFMLSKKLLNPVILDSGIGVKSPEYTLTPLCKEIYGRLKGNIAR